jgi:chaperonin cofactor prefoldin
VYNIFRSHLERNTKTMTKENLYIKEIQTLNKQLYNSYKRIKELRKEIDNANTKLLRK